MFQVTASVILICINTHHLLHTNKCISFGAIMVLSLISFVFVSFFIIDNDTVSWQTKIHIEIINKNENCWVHLIHEIILSCVFNYLLILGLNCLSHIHQNIFSMTEKTKWRKNKKEINFKHQLNFYLIYGLNEREGLDYEQFFFFFFVSCFFRHWMSLYNVMII